MPIARDTLGVAWPRAERQAIEHLLDLLVGKQLAGRHAPAAAAPWRQWRTTANGWNDDGDAYA